MGKLVIACLLTVLLGGAAMFIAGTQVGRPSVPKAQIFTRASRPPQSTR